MFLLDHLAAFDKKLKLWSSIKSEVWGVPTGLPTLDKKLGGLQNGELIVVAGRPSTGKTALVAQVCFDVARFYRDNYPEQMVAFFSAEMPGWTVLLREVSRQTGIAMKRILSYQIDKYEAELIQDVREELATVPIFIEDTPNLPTFKVEQFLNECKNLYSQTVGLVAYDYVQIAMDSRDSDVGRISQASRRFRKLARQFDCPMLVLSQFSRDDEGENATPKLGKLKGSGTIEEIADQVWGIHRPRDFDDELIEEEEQMLGDVDLWILKNRNGPTGKVKGIRFDPNRTCFVDAETVNT